MEKIDLKKLDMPLYSARDKKVSAVDVPLQQFLQCEGMGDPNQSQAFSQVCAALFSVSYKVKFAIKKSELLIDYGVMPLEALWWASDGDFNHANKNNWQWRLMIRQPDFVSQTHVDTAIAEVKKKGGESLPKLILADYREGPAIQTLHCGAYSDVSSSVGILQDHIAAHNLKVTGKFHEIYLNDPARVAPEKIKTIIRQPVE